MLKPSSDGGAAEKEREGAAWFAALPLFLSVDRLSGPRHGNETACSIRGRGDHNTCAGRPRLLRINHQGLLDRARPLSSPGFCRVRAGTLRPEGGIDRSIRRLV